MKCNAFRWHNAIVDLCKVSLLREFELDSAEVLESLCDFAALLFAFVDCHALTRVKSRNDDSGGSIKDSALLLDFAKLFVFMESHFLTKCLLPPPILDSVKFHYVAFCA